MGVGMDRYESERWRWYLGAEIEGEEQSRPPTQVPPYRGGDGPLQPHERGERGDA